MDRIFQKLCEMLDSGKDGAIVTIVSGSGSTPRSAGARMLVGRDGGCLGTIGGGVVEFEAKKIALRLIEKRQSAVQSFHLAPNQAADLGMVCGGKVSVFFQYISPENRDACRQFREIADICLQEESAWLILDITEGSPWKMGLFRAKEGLRGMEISQTEPLLKNKAVLVEMDGRTYYSEPLVKAGKVYLFGGGHVAQETVPVLSHLDFSCTVLDDREEFANKKVFPQAKEIFVCDYGHIGDYVSITEEDYVIIMTRGHLSDLEVQAQVLLCHPYYVGIMGSRHKIAAVTKKLLEQGFSSEEINRCHMPIGTAIQAETPAEIAISIAGELIQERARKKQER